MTTNISAYNLSERQTQLDLSVLPYDFEDNVKVLSEQARQTWNDVQDLEASACPESSNHHHNAPVFCFSDLFP